MQFSKRLTLFGAVLFASIGGYIFRFLQRKNELLADGILAEGAYLHTVLLILSLVVVLGSAIVLWKVPQRASCADFAGGSILPVIGYVASAFMLFGSLFALIQGVEPASSFATSAPEFSNFLNQFLPPLGIVAAACLAYYFYQCRAEKPSALLYMAISLYLTVRLIVRFQAWNTDPSIHDYCYALLANIAAMLAAFHMAGFSFDKGKRRISLFWIICAVFFSAITLADAVYDGEIAEMFIHCATLWMLGANFYQLIYMRSEEALQEDCEQ